MQLSIRIPDEYGSKLAVLAEQMRLKKTDILRLALKQFVDENLTDDAPYEKIKHLLGTAESGIGDLGKNHRKYLTEKFKRKI